MNRRFWFLPLLAFTFFLLVHFIIGCSQPKAQVSIISKELVSNGTNMAVVKGKIKNEGSADASVIVKVKLLDDSGNVLEEPFEMVAIKKGETADFEVKSSINFYQVKKFEVTIE